MKIEEQLQLVVDTLEKGRAKDIKAFDTTKITGLFDRVVILSANARQTKSLADNVIDAAKKAGLEVLAYEGADTGEWVLVDLGDIVIHHMQPAIREYYNLEELWGDTPIELNLKTDTMPNLSDD